MCASGPALPQGPGSLHMICGAWVLLFWPQINGLRCQQFLHFKQTSGHRLHLQPLISSSDQTGADIRPLKMNITPLPSLQSISFGYILSIHKHNSGQSETEAVISQQQGHYSSRSKAVTAVAGTHVWSRPKERKPCDTLQQEGAREAMTWSYIIHRKENKALNESMK